MKEVMRMKAGFIGAGKVGFSLGKYLKYNGTEVAGYFSRNEDSAKLAADFTDTKAYKTIEGVLKDSDTLFLTVPDGSIGKVWDYMKNLDVENKNICHCSGSISSAAFFDAEKRGAFVYSVHPLYAVSDKYNSWKDLSRAFFVIEGSAGRLEEIKAVFAGMGNRVVGIDTEKKSLYHAAAVMASNLVTSLFLLSSDMLCSCGFGKEAAQEALMPLFKGNAENIEKYGALSSLTGPVERNDAGTVKKHVEALSADEDWLKIYELLSQNLVKNMRAAYPERDCAAMERVLKNERR